MHGLRQKHSELGIEILDLKIELKVNSSDFLVLDFAVPYDFHIEQVFPYFFALCADATTNKDVVVFLNIGP